MNLKFLLCKLYQRQIDAYLDKRLSPRARRRLARHIDECPACYRAYVQRRELRRELQAGVPLLGRHHQPDFDRMWEAVRAELPQPRHQVSFRYGLAALMLLLALLVPFTMGNRDLMHALPDQPEPNADFITETPPGGQAIAAATLAAPNTYENDLELATPPTLPEPGK